MSRRRNGKPRRTNRRLLLESLETRAMMHAAGVLSGSVYFDTDGDGTRDATEVGVPGVVLQLAQAGSADRSTITDGNGRYTFDELLPGTYQVSKRQTPATVDGQDSTAVTGAVASNNRLSNLVLADDQILEGIDFSERTLRAEFINIGWFFASSPPARDLLRASIALGEEQAGESALASTIRAGGTNVPDGPNRAPSATDDAFSVAQGGVLTVPAASGVLANDTDADGDALTATRISQPANGSVTLNANGSFTYTPTAGFSGSDSFTYRANDGTVASNLATVRITVSPTPVNQPFGAVTPGAFTDAGLLGTRTDLVTGAPAITAAHRDGAISYAGYSNPPTYGDHHGFDSAGTDVNPGITPRPTGVYTSEQPDEDLIHNLEHGHVWISYDPALISATDLAALEKLVRDGSPSTNGGGVGVILTPRAANDTAIALASWARLLTLDSYNPTTIRNFVETNRGKAPEGFITP